MSLCTPAETNRAIKKIINKIFHIKRTTTILSNYSAYKQSVISMENLIFIYCISYEIVMKPSWVK